MVSHRSILFKATTVVDPSTAKLPVAALGNCEQTVALHADAVWRDRYGQAFEEWRLPKGDAPHKALGEVIGADGHHLLAAAYGPSVLPWRHDLPAVQVLRRAWVSQFYIEADRVTGRVL